MSEQATNYDDVKQYRLDPERERARGAAAAYVWFAADSGAQ